MSMQTFKMLLLSVILAGQLLSLIQFADCELSDEDKEEIRNISRQALIDGIDKEIRRQFDPENFKHLLNSTVAENFFKGATGYSVKQAILFIILALTLPGIIVTVLGCCICGIIKFGFSATKNICCCCVKTVTPLSS